MWMKNAAGTVVAAASACGQEDQAAVTTSAG